MTATTPGSAELLALADKLDSSRWNKITHGINVSLSHQEMDLARDALRLAAKPDEDGVCAELNDDQIMDILRNVCGQELFGMLTFKRWKDGIDIDYPTFAAQRLAAEFRALSATGEPKP